MKYCTATQSTMPNHSGHARGRKLHATKDGLKTLCNQKVDKMFEVEQVKNTVYWNRKCKNCYHGN